MSGDGYRPTAPARINKSHRPRALRVGLWAQRRAHVVPGPLRAFAGRMLQRLGLRRTPPTEPSEDWSLPLILDQPKGAYLASLTPPAAEASIVATSKAPVAIIEAAGRLRCAVATGILDVGGGEEIAAFLARRLPAVGLDTVVLHAGTRLAGQADAGGRLARSLREAGVATVELSPGTAPAWFARHRPDVVSGHYAPDWMLDAAVTAGVPWVETLHGMNEFLNPRVWKGERQRAAGISAQIAISDLVRRQYLAGNPGYPAHRVVTIPNGIEELRHMPVDRARARAALGLRDEFLFLSLARYCLQKNTYALVAAFAEVAAVHPEAHLLCAGRAADDLLYFEQTRLLAESLPTADRIHLRGHCANVPALLAAADAFVLDSFFEGWSLASMEALGSGLPVVMSDVSGAREQLGWGGERGHLVANPAGDPELVDWRLIAELRFRPQRNRDELVAAMSSVVRDREKWSARRERLRREARDLFPADVSLHRHARVLRAVALGEPTLDLAPTGIG